MNSLPRLDHRVWILMAGRLLSQLGTGFTLFYAPIFFVNQVGLSAAVVGFGLGSGSITGVLGRILGGTWSDSPQVGRRSTLLLSAAIAAIASFLLAWSTTVLLFLAANLLMGFGIGLYWPATEAVVADITTPAQRNEAFALTRLADSIGLGLGVALGGLLISATEAYRALFIIDGISYLVFYGIIHWTIAETRNPDATSHTGMKGWSIALSDRPLQVYVLANILFTTYLALVNSALPLYFSNFVRSHDQGLGIAPPVLSGLFSWYVVLAALLQLPVARALNRYSHPRILTISALFWGISFILIWITGTSPQLPLLSAALALSLMAIATVAYTPSASSFVAGLAPESLRGIYLSINSLCWAVGYFIGPAMGGWAMDQAAVVAHGFWIGVAFSVLVAIGILQRLEQRLEQRL